MYAYPECNVGVEITDEGGYHDALSWQQQGLNLNRPTTIAP